MSHLIISGWKLWRQSARMLYYSLNNTIECEKLCREIDGLIQKYKMTKGSQDLSGALLVITIKEPTDTTSDPHVMKLEHKIS